jgi:uncharacterized protein YodC (DUF2158 family)
MTVFRSGNLVVLKSGGPVMTVDAVNTDIFDDNKVTGIVCVWFIGASLQRARFERDAIEPAPLQNTASRKRKARPELIAGEYMAVLDEMVTAMNAPADTAGDGSASRRRSARLDRPAPSFPARSAVRDGPERA